MPNKSKIDPLTIQNWILLAATILAVFSGGMLTEDLLDILHIFDQ